MQAGVTFLIPDKDDHLWMIISDPDQNTDCVVVCFLSWREKHDQACVVSLGEHPFVKHDTCVNYRGAMVVSLERLLELDASNSLRYKEPLSPELLQRIRSSAENSDIPTRAYNILRDQGFVV